MWTCWAIREFRKFPISESSPIHSRQQRICISTCSSVEQSTCSARELEHMTISVCQSDGLRLESRWVNFGRSCSVAAKSHGMGIAHTLKHEKCQKRSLGSVLWKSCCWFPKDPLKTWRFKGQDTPSKHSPTKHASTEINCRGKFSSLKQRFL